MIDSVLHVGVDRFIASGWQHNEWIRGAYLEIYLRKSERFIDGKFLPAIDLANVADMPVKHQLQGVFPAFLDHLEGKGIIYIENVLSHQLQWYYRRRGYNVYGVDPFLDFLPGHLLPCCFYKINPTTKQLG